MRSFKVEQFTLMPRSDLYGISHNYKSESLNLANKQLRNRLSYMQSWHIQRISMACRLVTSIFDPDIWVPGITGPDPLVVHKNG